MKRFRIKIVGESGSGLLSTGEMLSEALHSLGYFTVSDREYPSLIKGGHSCFTLNISDEPIHSLSDEADLMIMLDKQGLEAYHDKLKKGGLLVHGYDREMGLKKILETMTPRKVKVVAVRAREMAAEQGGNVLMTNVILLGTVWKLMGFPFKVVEDLVRKTFAHKPALLEIDLRCVKAGYEQAESALELFPVKKSANKNTVLIDGNKALTLGAIHAGVRAYFAYPMSPSSTILTHMADMASKTGVLVKQAEDEITAAQMALGAMFMGTRAFTSTSGGGFDLMTETLSLAGMIENPFVVVIAQRPGPATGLPTWTGQGDYPMVLHSGHGEYPRIVLAVSDAQDAFALIQHAFNWAEKFQSPVLVLTEKVIAESIWSTPRFKENTIKIERGLITGAELKTLQNSDRYKITASGISKRWLPSSADATYFANGDEHWEDGSLTEESLQSSEMIAKRMRKIKAIEAAMPEPVLYGPKKAKISFIGWGSSKNSLVDAIAKHEAVNYLHFSVLNPIKTKTLKAFLKDNKNVHLIEGNHEGPFGQSLEAKVGPFFKGRLLKWDGRPFFTEDIDAYIKKHA